MTYGNQAFFIHTTTKASKEYERRKLQPTTSSQDRTLLRSSCRQSPDARQSRTSLLHHPLHSLPHPHSRGSITTQSWVYGDDKRVTHIMWRVTCHTHIHPSIQHTLSLNLTYLRVSASRLIIQLCNHLDTTLRRLSVFAMSQGTHTLNPARSVLYVTIVLYIWGDILRWGLLISFWWFRVYRAADFFLKLQGCSELLPKDLGRKMQTNLQELRAARDNPAASPIRQAHIWPWHGNRAQAVQAWRRDAAV